MNKFATYQTLFFAMILVMLSACSSIKTREQIQIGSDQKKSESPIQNPTSEDLEEEGLIQSIRRRAVEPKVAVVLGPAGFKSLAYGPVLKALQLEKIKVEKIIGIEWGALPSAFFAHEGKGHEVEWRLYKLTNEILRPSGFLGVISNRSSTKEFAKYLKDNIGHKEISQLALSWSCPVLETRSSRVTWVESGSLQKALESCLNSSPHWPNEALSNTVAALLTTAEAIEKLKSQGYNVVIFVDGLGAAGPALTLPSTGQKTTPTQLSDVMLWAEAKRSLIEARQLATDVISLNLPGAINDLSTRDQWQRLADQAGREGARSLVKKYGL